MKTQESIAKVIDRDICDNGKTYSRYKQRVKEGKPTRDENPETHFCVYFLPYDSQSKKVFVIHHKKSGLWLSPGGHIDKDETLLAALNREIGEELGIWSFFKSEPQPFLFTITPIENPVQPCQSHYDIWYLLLTDGSNFNIDLQEFYTAKWLTIEAARKIVTDPSTLKAFQRLQT